MRHIRRIIEFTMLHHWRNKCILRCIACATRRNNIAVPMISMYIPECH